MRVLIDGRRIGYHGTGRYLMGLLPALLEYDPTHRYSLLVSADMDRLQCRIPKAVRTITLPVRPYDPASGHSINAIVRRGAFDVFHAPYNVLPTALTCASVTTIHDAIHALYPYRLPDNRRIVDILGGDVVSHMRDSARTLQEVLTRQQKELVGAIDYWGLRYALVSLRYAMLRSNVVLSVSTTSARDIVRAADVDRPIIVTTNALDPEISRLARSAREIVARPMGGGRYILVIARHVPHKGVERMLRAFQLAREALDSGMRLVIIGSGLTRYPEIRRAIREMALVHVVVCMENVTDADLVTTYRGASMVVVPSDYEGFGLVVLEAMACRTPVIVSSGGALPEVVGGAGIVATTVEEMAAAMVAIGRSDELRAKLVVAGERNLERFDWRRTVQRTVSAYEEAYLRRITGTVDDIYSD